MKDPTRIARIIHEFERAWEGQPELSFLEMVECLTTYVGFGAADDDVRAGLDRMRQRWRSRLRDGDLGQRIAVVETSNPQRRISLHGPTGRVTIRAYDRAVMPTTWISGSIRRLVTGEPMILTTSEGVDHRLGVVLSIRVEDVAEVAEISGRRRREMGDDVYLLRLTSAETGSSYAILDHRLHHVIPRRRTVDTFDIAYERVIRCAVGENLVIAKSPTSELHTVGLVEEIVLLDC